MKMENKLYCHWDFVRFIQEKHLEDDTGKRSTLSVTHGDTVELMIFLGKADNDTDYEARIYKAETTDKYVPHENDKVKIYEENDEYATFIFEKFEYAHEFVDYLAAYHPEYIVRPTRKI